MPRNIVVCCDGTGNEYGDRNTNVLKLFSVLKRDANQVVFYDPGVGTMSAPAALTRTAKAVSKAMGLAFGAGITKSIEDAYTFLMNNYRKDDAVYLFGFSRGAYTARAIAAMIYKCGLLESGNINLVPYASKMFKNQSDYEIYSGFKNVFSGRCAIHFLGLWDTVKSVGWIYDPFTLQFTMDNPIVKTVRHAVAIDERRSFYRQNHWGDPRPHQDVKQVWFAGVHSDVGGSYPSAESGPSEITLRWMIREAAKAGLVIDQKKLEIMLPEDRDSINAPRLHESLTGVWWFPEYLPRRYKDRSKGYKPSWKVYRGEPRWIGDGALIHQSVVDRMEKTDYAPQNLPFSYVIEPYD
jgi:uncharacterized protein (DUF2235 family)